VRFPSYQDLSEEQDEINNLPLKGRYLITGPPGTGKTVMALYRGQMISQRGERVRILMHGKLLSQYTAQVVEQLGIEGSVSTFHSWIGTWCRTNWRRNMPALGPYQPDWSTIIDLAIEKPPAPDVLENLLVDEGQDMAPEFFMFGRMIAPNLTVFADENQRIKDENSTLEEIREKVRPDMELTLTRNYRNTQEIAIVAAAFRVDEQSKSAGLPDRRGPRPELHAYPRTHEAVQHIAMFAQNYRRKSIGVLVPNTKLLKCYRNRLAAALPRDMPLQYYLSTDKDCDVDFSAAGVTIVNWASAKGLEFDAVFLPELQDVRQASDDPTLHMQLYVLTSRAREQLFMSYTGAGTPEILRCLPLEHLDVTG